MTIPLLKLPYLVIKQILESTSFLELFFLTQLSKRMKRIIKNHAKIRNHGLKIYVYDDVRFEFISLKTQQPVNSFVLKPTKKLETSPSISYFDLKFEKCGAVPCITTNSILGFPEMDVYCDDSTLAKEMYDKISDIFAVPVERAEMNLRVRDNYKWYVEWLNNFNIPKIEICGHLCDFTQYIDTIQTLRSSGKVIFCAKQATFHTLEALNVNLEHVTFHEAEWIRPHYLESMNSSFIGISKVSFSDKDVNKFLHALKSGSYPNLKEITMELSRRANTNVIFDGLNTDETPDGWNFDLDNGKHCSVWYGVYDDSVNLRGIEVTIKDN